MFAWLKKYRERMQHKHGWEVELSCPECSHNGAPKYEGWEPNKSIRFGNNATIFAKLSCAKCGHDLRESAGGKLVELFRDIAVPKRNRRIIFLFVGFMLVWLALMLIGQLWTFAFFILLGPMIMYFNYKVASIRFKCECGNPDYLFMGLLGRSYCYRCSTCGNLLRVRD